MKKKIQKFLGLKHEQQLSNVGPFYFRNMHDDNPNPLKEIKIQRLKELLYMYGRDYIDGLLKEMTLTLFRTGKHNTSLRIIDWFVTNYSKTWDVTYKVGDEIVNVYKAYLRSRRNYKRMLFDPFRRNEMVYYIDPPSGEIFCTTVAQVNFFVFLCRYDMLKYIRSHFAEIERDQIEKLTAASNRKTTAQRKGEEFRRQKLSADLAPTCVVYQTPCSC